jgi:hypothetical protein
LLLEALELPLTTVDKGFKAGLAVAAAGVAALVGAMGLAINATFKWADELDSLQDVMGVSNETAAAFNFTLRKSGTSTEALSRGVVILNKGLVKADGTLDTVGKELKDFGINVLGANGQVKDQAMLMGEIAEKYASFSTQQERVNFLTGVFGRSGAELIDFFDTLAAEGGIDEVTKKVEALGLAIDPNRYEQFNRNLEELKLIGLGLAVSFTEKVMPAIEGFLGVITDFAKKPDFGRLLEQMDAFGGKIIKGLGDSIRNWVSSGGPEELSEALIGWVEGIGESEGTKSKIQIAAEHLLKALSDAVQGIDWGGIAQAIDEKLAEMLGEHDWHASGDSFGKMLESVIGTGIETGESKAVPALGQAISDWLLGAMGVANWREAEVRFVDILQHLFIELPLQSFAQMVKNFGLMTLLAGRAAVSGLMQSIPSFAPVMGSLRANLETALGAISKTFEQKAYSWVNKAVDAFNSTKSKITGAISALVAQINTILKKIISSFGLTFTGVNWGGFGGSTGGSGDLGGSSGGGTTGGGNKPPKPMASGGSALAGQLLMVGEMGPELFVPRTNGAIIPNDALGQPSVVRLDDSQLRTLADLIGMAVVKAENNR